MKKLTLARMRIQWFGGVVLTLLTSAALLGIDACPFEGIEPAKYDEILGLQGSGYATVAACPLGYRAADDKYASTPKVRFEPEEVVELR